MKTEKNKDKLIFVPKGENKSKDIVACLIEAVILDQKLSIQDVKNLSNYKLKKILEQILQEYSSKQGELKNAVVYSNDILKEANILKNRKQYQIALILYATAIEHTLNEIIHKTLIKKKDLSIKEIENIMRLDIESKRTWLFPVLGLPRLSTNCSNNIKQIADKRNEFVHYKWKGKLDEELETDNYLFENLCNKATQTIASLRRFKTINIISTNKIKKILTHKIKNEI